MHTLKFDRHISIHLPIHTENTVLASVFQWSLFTHFDKGKDNYSYTSLYCLVGRVTEDTKKNKKVFSYKFKNDRLLFPLYGIPFYWK